MSFAWVALCQCAKPKKLPMLGILDYSGHGRANRSVNACTSVPFKFSV